MKPKWTLAETHTPDGARLTLHEQDGVHTIRLNGGALMDSAAHASELALGEIVTAQLAAASDARILIGGLGLGFTLRSALAGLPPTAVVEVVELLAAVETWNRELLRDLNGALLDDPRVHVTVADVWHVLSRTANESLDAVALDIDNGPVAMVQGKNIRVYERRGIELISRVLKSKGRLAVWSAGRDVAFEKTLEKARFRFEAVPVKRHTNARQNSHLIYVADLKY